MLENKNHRCLVPSWIWESVGSLGGLDNVEYGNLILLKKDIFEY